MLRPPRTAKRSCTDKTSGKVVDKDLGDLLDLETRPPAMLQPQLSLQPCPEEATKATRGPRRLPCRCGRPAFPPGSLGNR